MLATDKITHLSSPSSKEINFLQRKRAIDKNEKLSNDIRKLYNDVFHEPIDSISENCCKPLKLGGVFLSEIGVPLINGFVGMHSLLADHFHSPNMVFIYLISMLLTSIDSVVHYALMFSIYKAAVGLVDAPTLDDVKTTREQLIFLNKILTRLSELENLNAVAPHELEALGDYYRKIIQKKKNANKIKFLREFERVILLGVFIALRISGGYFILTKFFIAISATSFAFTPWGFGIMWCVIALYAYKGYVTRRAAISDFLYPLPEEKFDEVEKKFDKLKGQILPQNKDQENKDTKAKAREPEIEIISVPSLTLSDDVKDLYYTISSKLPEEIPKNCCKNYIKLGGVILSEIGLPFISGFVGMHALLIDHLPSLEGAVIYLISFAFTTADSIVHYALMLPVYKEAAGFSPEVTVDYFKKKREKLVFLDKIISNLIEIEEDKEETPLKDKDFKELKNYYQKVMEEKCNVDNFIFLRKFSKVILLSVFVALRVSGGYFILTKFFLAIGATSFALTPWGLGIMWGVVALYAYKGYLTRRTAISDLLFPLPQQKFIEIEEKFNKLELQLGLKQELAEIKKENSKITPSPPLLSNESSPCLSKSSQVTFSSHLRTKGFHGFLEVISKQPTLEKKNAVFQAGKNLKIFNQHRNPYFDDLLLFKRTRTWREGVKTIRDSVYNDLIANLTGEVDGDIKKLTLAQNMSIFNEHRSNWFFAGAFGRTATVKKIETQIKRLRRNQ